MTTERSRLLLLLIGGLILLGLMIRDGELLLLAIPLLVYLMLGLLRAPTDVALLAHRTLSNHGVEAHDLVDIHVRVENRGEALANLWLRDEPLSGMVVSDGQTSRGFHLSSGESTDISYVVRADRGAYSWASIQARACDPFGLFAYAQAVPAPGSLIVRPRVMTARRLYLKPLATKLAAGPFQARKAGTGTDYWGIREYRPGDSLRRLNWRLAARHPGRRFTNEFQREEIADFGLILDTRRLSNVDRMELALLESRVSAAASLVEAFLKSGSRVSLLLFGRTMSPIFPGSGKHQLDRMLTSLARAGLSSYVPFDFVKYFPARLFPTHSELVVISNMDGRDLQAYAQLRAFGYNVQLISPDPVDYEARTPQHASSDSLGLRAAKIERIAYLKRLLQLGVKVIDWKVDQPLDTAMQAATRHDQPRRRLRAG
jgi:uncharacterized protein (DUF58 family)